MNGLSWEKHVLDLPYAQGVDHVVFVLFTAFAKPRRRLLDSGTEGVSLLRSELLPDPPAVAMEAPPFRFPAVGLEEVSRPLIQFPDTLLKTPGVCNRCGGRRLRHEHGG